MLSNKENGKVYLLGAGPGDEGLITVKSAEILQQADVVVYDRLVSDRILAKIPDTAEKINVGKNAHNHSVPQDEINRILLKQAQDGKLVVRLKGGDPFLFGRGGEELELLAENNIPFEVVPGVTSAIAAAAYAGIPVTHRDFCSSLHIITGHAKKDNPLNIDYDSIVKLSGTLVFMMSVSSIGEIANGLMGAGLSDETKVAVIENGTRSNQRKFVSQLDNIADIIEEHNVKSPATIVVGGVCSLSDKFDWYSKLPLKGCRILVTRPNMVAGTLSKQLYELGAEAVECPCIKIDPIDFEFNIDGLDWIIFTSPNGVQSFFDKLFKLELDSRYLFGKRIAVVGTGTSKELLKYSICADFVPSVFDGEHLALELLKGGHIKEGQRVGLFRAEVASDEIYTVLKSNNVDVADTAVYKTSYVKNSDIDVESFDYVTFTSAGCVNGFVASCNENVDFTSINAICIGEQTAKMAISVGMNVHVCDIATIPSMVEKLLELHQKSENKGEKKI